MTISATHLQYILSKLPVPYLLTLSGPPWSIGDPFGHRSSVQYPFNQSLLSVGDKMKTARRTIMSARGKTGKANMPCPCSIPSVVSQVPVPLPLSFLPPSAQNTPILQGPMGYVPHSRTSHARGQEADAWPSKRWHPPSLFSAGLLEQGGQALSIIRDSAKGFLTAVRTSHVCVRIQVSVRIHASMQVCMDERGVLASLAGLMIYRRGAFFSKEKKNRVRRRRRFP